MTRIAAALLVLLPVAVARAQPAPPPAPAPGPAPNAAPLQPETPPPPAWVPRAGARLVLLDKISARPHTIMLKVGQSATFGALTIMLRACAVRPPDQPQDATAFLDVANAHQGMPGFRGWMFADEPAANMLQDPVYDVRLAGCTG